jgi:hypothetical protein
VDPTQALTDIRGHINEFRTTREELPADAFGDLVTKVQGLDEWMSNGGFLPEQWKRSMGRPRLVRDGPVLDGVEHGKRRSYNEGCHCTLCRAANRLRRNLTPAEIKEISNAESH